jgi:creatinine amidohydrolase
MPYELAVITIGATEPHNLHLPFGIDSINAVHVASKAAERANARGAKVVVLPNLPYGQDHNLLDFPLTMSVSTGVTELVLGELCHCIERHGIPKCVIVNGHGGNNLKAALRDLSTKHHLFVGLVDWWVLSELPGDEPLFEKGGEHGSEEETSWLLSHRPDLVKLERADEGKVRTSTLPGFEERWFWCSRPWHRLTTNSGFGDPRAASAEKGRVAVERAVERLSENFHALAKAPMDDDFPFDGPYRSP